MKAMNPAEVGQVVWDILEQSGQPWAAVLSRLASDDVWRQSAGGLHEALLELAEVKQVELACQVELHAVVNAACMHGLRIFITRMDAIHYVHCSLDGSTLTFTNIRYRIVRGAMPRVEVRSDRDVLEEIPLLHPRLALRAVEESRKRGERAARLSVLLSNVAG